MTGSQKLRRRTRTGNAMRDALHLGKPVYATVSSTQRDKVAGLLGSRQRPAPESPGSSLPRRRYSGVARRRTRSGD